MISSAISAMSSGGPEVAIATWCPACRASRAMTGPTCPAPSTAILLVVLMGLALRCRCGIDGRVNGLYPGYIPATRLDLVSQSVTWGPPQPERADAARNRRLLLATARQMLEELGAHKLTMDGLAERAGLGKGTVYRRFGTRPGIFQALLDDDEVAFQEEVLFGPPPLGPG